ncbi:hypothetical protein WJX81_007636 [Elliptochloris bilobata]|uniref:Peptidoglycan binding-like domain-containing protein n=1 Tax=Elliptochloris bilobata TaxID=381761 RepID=A0AAW1SJ56_9CHLO
MVSKALWRQGQFSEQAAPGSYATPLQEGSSGAEVLGLQRALHREGLLALSGVTARYSARTARAVAAWQRARGLSPSGRLEGVGLQLFRLQQEGAHAVAEQTLSVETAASPQILADVAPRPLAAPALMVAAGLGAVLLAGRLADLWRNGQVRRRVVDDSAVAGAAVEEETARPSRRGGAIPRTHSTSCASVSQNVSEVYAEVPQRLRLCTEEILPPHSDTFLSCISLGFTRCGGHLLSYTCGSCTSSFSEKGFHLQVWAVQPAHQAQLVVNVPLFKAYHDLLSFDSSECFLEPDVLAQDVAVMICESEDGRLLIVQNKFPASGDFGLTEESTVNITVLPNPAVFVATIRIIFAADASTGRIAAMEGRALGTKLGITRVRLGIGILAERMLSALCQARRRLPAMNNTPLQEGFPWTC